MKGYIYSIWDNNEEDIFYIGASTCPKTRLKQHINENRKKNKEDKKKFNLSILEEVDFLKRSELEDREIFWLLHYSKKDKPLTNKIFYKKRLAGGVLKYKYKPPRIPPELEMHILQIQSDMKIKKLSGMISMKAAIIQIIKEHKEIYEQRKGIN